MIIDIARDLRRQDQLLVGGGAFEREGREVKRNGLGVLGHFGGAFKQCTRIEVLVAHAEGAAHRRDNVARVEAEMNARRAEREGVHARAQQDELFGQVRVCRFDRIINERVGGLHIEEAVIGLAREIVCGGDEVLGI